MQKYIPKKILILLLQLLLCPLYSLYYLYSSIEIQIELIDFHKWPFVQGSPLNASYTGMWKCLITCPVVSIKIRKPENIHSSFKGKNRVQKIN